MTAEINGIIASPDKSHCKFLKHDISGSKVLWLRMFKLKGNDKLGQLLLANHNTNRVKDAS